MFLNLPQHSPLGKEYASTSEPSIVVVSPDRKRKEPLRVASRSNAAVNASARGGAREVDGQRAAGRGGGGWAGLDDVVEGAGLRIGPEGELHVAIRDWAGDKEGTDLALISEVVPIFRQLGTALAGIRSKLPTGLPACVVVKCKLVCVNKGGRKDRARTDLPARSTALTSVDALSHISRFAGSEIISGRCRRGRGSRSRRTKQQQDEGERDWRGHERRDRHGLVTLCFYRIWTKKIWRMREKRQQARRTLSPVSVCACFYHGRGASCPAACTVSTRHAGIIAAPPALLCESNRTMARRTASNGAIKAAARAAKGHSDATTSPFHASPTVCYICTRDETTTEPRKWQGTAALAQIFLFNPMNDPFDRLTAPPSRQRILCCSGGRPAPCGRRWACGACRLIGWSRGGLISAARRRREPCSMPRVAARVPAAVPQGGHSELLTRLATARSLRTADDGGGEGNLALKTAEGGRVRGRRVACKSPPPLDNRDSRVRRGTRLLAAVAMAGVPAEEILEARNQTSRRVVPTFRTCPGWSGVLLVGDIWWTKIPAKAHSGESGHRVPRGDGPARARLPLEVQQQRRDDRGVARALRRHLQRHHLRAALHAQLRPRLRHALVLGRQRHRPAGRALRLPSGGGRCRFRDRSQYLFGSQVPSFRPRFSDLPQHFALRMVAEWKSK
ncbi:Protein of unknown function [Gryllus bimaculatus]|nr:Protein of unknown function [Gryllus bimaculatus]